VPLQASEQGSDRRRLHAPRRTPAFFAGAAILAAGLPLLGIGLGRASSSTVSTPAYASSGTFSHVPRVLASSDRATVRFSYAFGSSLPHAISGTISLQALVRARGGRHSLHTLIPPVRFRGDRTAVASTVRLRDLAGLGRTFEVELRPVLRYEGVVDGSDVRGVFSPGLPFTIDRAQLRLDVSAPAARPGAADAPTRGEALRTALHPHENGLLPRTEAAVVSLPFLTATVGTLRLGGSFLALVGLLLVVAGRRRDVESPQERIAARAGCLLVDVVSLDLGGPTPTEVPSFESLVALACQAERPVLHACVDGLDLFAVDDPPRLYLHRLEPARTPQPATARRKSSRRRRIPLPRLAAPLPALAFGVARTTVAGAAQARPAAPAAAGPPGDDPSGSGPGRPR
jgi:hypothetical protein